MNEDVALREAAKVVVGGGTQDPLCNRRSAKGRNLHRLQPKYSGNHQPGKNQENNQETNQETTDFCDFGFSTLSPLNFAGLTPTQIFCKVPQGIWKIKTHF